jgi:hypothetical protein
LLGTTAGPVSPPLRMSAREVSFSLPLGRTSPWHVPHFSTSRGRTSFSKKSPSPTGGSAACPVDRKSAKLNANASKNLKARLVFRKSLQRRTSKASLADDEIVINYASKLPLSSARLDCLPQWPSHRGTGDELTVFFAALHQAELEILAGAPEQKPSSEAKHLSSLGFAKWCFNRVVDCGNMAKSAWTSWQSSAWQSSAGVRFSETKKEIQSCGGGEYANQ